MFLSESYSRAKEIADVLAGANHERQKLESSALKEVSGLIDGRWISTGTSSS